MHNFYFLNVEFPIIGEQFSMTPERKRQLYLWLFVFLVCVLSAQLYNCSVVSEAVKTEGCFYRLFTAICP